VIVSSGYNHNARREAFVTLSEKLCCLRLNYMFRPNFVDHLVFRVRDMDRTARFYSALLGEPYKEDGYIMYRAGDTLLFFTPSIGSTEPYNKEKVGLNHIALGVRTIDELRIVDSQLNLAAIAHSGIKVWQDGLTRNIWLDDPDGIRVEYWLRSPEET
jgi:glyoxylase I family protein